MRLIFAALAVGLFATAAQADGLTIGSCGSSGPDTSCPVDLVKGQDYELNTSGDGSTGTIELVNPAGVVTIHQEGTWEEGVGWEFRAAYSATYQIRLTHVAEGSGPYVTIATDCRDGAKTQCSLSPGTKKDGVNTSTSDGDWYRVSMRKGKTYNFTCTAGGYTEIALLDGNSRLLANAHNHSTRGCVIGYRARASGTYYIAVGQGYGYTIGMN